MKVENWKIEDVIPYENNPRKNDEAVEYVANSIREFGFQQPIVVDSNGVIIVGHTRLKAAQVLGLKDVPVVVADGLSNNQVEAYRLADNKVSEFSDWNITKLNEELESIDWLDIDMAAFGFDSGEMDQMLEQIEMDEAVNEYVTGEVPFTRYIDEESQYVVLKFNNHAEWLQACSILNVQRVKSLPTRKDGSENKDFQFTGVGRVLDGVQAFTDIIENQYMMR